MTTLLKQAGIAVLLAAVVLGAVAQPSEEPYTTTYIRLGQNTEGLLLQPKVAGPRSDIALVYSHPQSDNFNARPGREMLERGYTLMMVNYRGALMNEEYLLPSISLGISYLRQIAGIDKVAILSHSGGTHVAAFYQNVAENGISACNGPEKIYPCSAPGLENLDPADGIILLDATLGAAHPATAIDPAIGGEGRRLTRFDMFSERNGFNPEGKTDYSPDFVERFYRAQARRNNALIDAVLERLELIERGRGEFSDDEPLPIRGVGVRALGARLYQPDTDFQSRTRAPHLLLSADGSQEEVIIHSVRGPINRHPDEIDELDSMNANTTVRQYLSDMAVRMTSDYALTEDDIIGIDWASSYTSTPSNAQGISVPTLVLAMGCHYLIVPDEIIYNHLAAEDKFYAVVEGATHGFNPCRPEYGDTASRAFGFVDQWLQQDGRF